MSSQLDEEFEVVGDLDTPDVCYGFDTLRVYRRRSDGALFTATDSGCSCPIPFENHTVADLTPYSEANVRRWATSAGADPGYLIALCKEASK